MILLIDNYDSFSYNLYQLIGEIEPDIRVIRNDELGVSDIRELHPERIVLYGPLFDHPYFLSRLKAEMAVGVDAAHAVPMEKSRFNNILENKAAGLLAVAQFLENGGFVE